MPESSVRIIKKKVGGHGGHHGGAWKVAYADFVTAMMALFIVLWLLNSSKQIQVAVGGYFKDPSGNSKKVGSNMQGSGENFAVSEQNMSKLKEELQKSISRAKDFEKLKDQIEMTVTSEGLRIELLETDKGTFFDLGSAQPNEDCKDLLKRLAAELSELPNKISIEGHSDAKPFSRSGGEYSNWELSTDRANAARRFMQQNGVRPDQVTQVRGYADQKLRKADDPEDPSNRRISFIVQYLPKPDSEPDAGEGGEKSKPGESTKPEAERPSAEKK